MCVADIARLLRVINQFVDSGNTVIVIEYNMEILENADWIIDMGPEGGSRGGKIVEGTPEEIIKIERSCTGQYLANALTSKSVLPAALGHGAVNGYIGSLIAPAADEMMTVPFGLPAMLPLLFTAVLAYKDLSRSTK